MIGDYQFVGTLNIEHARSARDDAVAFVSFCERLIEVL